MIASLLDAFELVSHSEQLLRRLDAASAELSKKPGLVEEKAWLETACTRLAKAREGLGDLLTRSLRLPELEPIKEDQARVLQNAAVDAVERLHAGIAFAGGNRAPLLEALYGKLKIAVLRRCDREDFEKFCTDFEKRLQTTYARRMFGDESYAVVLPALEELRASFAVWRGVFSSESLPDTELQALRDELDAAAHRLELPARQSRLLAQAALAPLKELLEEAQLQPRRRGGKSEEDEHPLLEQDPPDPQAPSEAELAELSGDAAAVPAPEVTEKPRRRKEKQAEA